jgi:cytochrome c5
MRLKIIIASAALASLSFLCAAADSPGSSGPTTPVVQSSAQADAMRLEGEKRFRANCGRCHAAPHKFPPRMMATIVRHMRVRATITDEDMRLVLFYITQ